VLGLIDITAINERNIDGRIVYPIRVLLVKRSYNGDNIFLSRLTLSITYNIQLVYKNA
jgi:hypothetical protein